MLWVVSAVACAQSSCAGWKVCPGAFDGGALQELAGGGIGARRNLLMRLVGMHAVGAIHTCWAVAWGTVGRRAGVQTRIAVRTYHDHVDHVVVIGLLLESRYDGFDMFPWVGRSGELRGQPLYLVVLRVVSIGAFVTGIAQLLTRRMTT